MLKYVTSYSGERVAEDPGLQPAEKETGISFSASDGYATINTHQGAIMRKLLQCSFFKVTEIEKRNGVVVGLTGQVPIGALSIKTPRKSNWPQCVVSVPRNNARE
jgi:hypothetical protein